MVVFHELVCPLTVVLPQIFFNLTTPFFYPVFFCLFHAPLDVVVHFPVFLRSLRFNRFFLNSILVWVLQITKILVLLLRGAGIACWKELRTRDRKVASSNPGRSVGRIFCSRLNFVCCYSVSVPPPCYRSGSKRPRSFCQKCRWQATLKHAYTLDLRKSQWVDYASVQAWCGTYMETCSHATCQGTFGHSHCELILA